MTEMASLEAYRISHRGPASQHLWSLPGSNCRCPHHIPFTMAAVCKARLAALPHTHCPWQLHRVGPRAQIMQPAQPVNQARRVGTHTKSKDPSPSIMEMRFFPHLFIKHETHVLTTEGQILDQMQRWRET